MDKLRRVLSGDDEPEEERGNILSQVVDGSTLDWSTRVKGFAICFALGFLFSFLGSVLLFFPRGLTIFAVFYTLGNILALASTCFLMGPASQLKRMFSPTRVVATIVMIAALAMTLVSAFVIKNSVLALLMVCIQFVAMTWYSLSYIPYARDAFKKCFGTCLDV